ncbi:MAG TPA: DegT/DnrJ/EryC1/StrS family aminotransferase [Azospirillaceae bacterium]|nr:DegT/DnrJ/EryC1/StrS family aminotransferase [Azospirillaceae bacterium]
MIPRLTLDIDWRDLRFAWSARADKGAEGRILGGIPADRGGVVCLSVRTALDALLAELKLPAGSEVLMSAVNIQNMADIVRAHELTVVPVDITLDGLAPTPAQLEAAVTPASRLFLLAHLFGARVPTEGLATVCRRHGLLFVEDCAQAYDGVLDASPGTDASLYSFGPIKTATALGGAVALFADRGLAARVRHRTAGYPPVPLGWWRRRVVKHMALKAASAPWATGLVIRLLALLGRDADAVIGGAARGFKAGDLLSQLRRRPPEPLLSLLARRLETPRRAQLALRLGERRGQVRRIVEGVGRAPGLHVARHAWWLLPVLTRDPATAIDRGRRAGFDVTRGATSLRAFAPAPVAEALIGQVVYLPLRTGMSAGQERALGAVAGRFDAIVDRADRVPHLSKVLEPTA